MTHFKRCTSEINSIWIVLDNVYGSIQYKAIKQQPISELYIFTKTPPPSFPKHYLKKHYLKDTIKEKW